jgi:hypothetical protein
METLAMPTASQVKALLDTIEGEEESELAALRGLLSRASSQGGASGVRKMVAQSLSRKDDPMCRPPLVLAVDYLLPRCAQLMLEALHPVGPELAVADVGGRTLIRVLVNIQLFRSDIAEPDRAVWTLVLDTALSYAASQCSSSGGGGDGAAAAPAARAIFGDTAELAVQQHRFGLVERLLSCGAPVPPLHTALACMLGGGTAQHLMQLQATALMMLRLLLKAREARSTSAGPGGAPDDDRDAYGRSAFLAVVHMLSHAPPPEQRGGGGGGDGAAAPMRAPGTEDEEHAQLQAALAASLALGQEDGHGAAAGDEQQQQGDTDRRLSEGGTSALAPAARQELEVLYEILRLLAAAAHRASKREPAVEGAAGPGGRGGATRPFSTVKKALRSGEQLGALDHDGGSALHYAAAAGKHQLVALLLRVGCSPHAPDAFGSTPLHAAAACARGGELESPWRGAGEHRAGECSAVQCTAHSRSKRR